MTVYLDVGRRSRREDRKASVRCDVSTFFVAQGKRIFAKEGDGREANHFLGA